MKIISSEYSNIIIIISLRICKEKECVCVRPARNVYTQPPRGLPYQILVLTFHQHKTIFTMLLSKVAFNSRHDIIGNRVMM